MTFSPSSEAGPGAITMPTEPLSKYLYRAYLYFSLIDISP